MYHRKAVLTGQDIELRVIFKDDADNLVDPDLENVTVYIYDPTIDDAVFDDEVENQTFTSAFLSAPAVRLSTGYYSFTFSVPSGGPEGHWRDVWVGEIDSYSVASAYNFIVTQGAEISIQPIGNNTMLVVELDGSIAGLSGLTLGEDEQLYFTTKYAPLYASPDLIRLEMGAWLDWIPDDTLALMAHWSSKEADFINGRKGCSGSRLRFARTKFVIYDAIYKFLMIPGQGQVAGYSVGRAKALGDLSIKDGAPVTTANADVLDWLKKQRDEWWRVMNAGGCINPGQGLGPGLAWKGSRDPDRRMIGRLWREGKGSGRRPSVNEKRVPPGKRKGKFDFWERD